jgi:hemerythrin-like metal-binding protein
MPALTWSAELALDHPQMDATHQDFVALLGAAQDALAESPERGLTAYEALVAHTVAHFGLEDRWMAATGFASGNCHGFHHAQVLQLMHEVARLAREQGDFGPLGRVLPELAAWFPVHAQTMDAALASHLDQLGFDPETGRCARPTPARPVSGCGGNCSSSAPETSGA